MSSRTRDAQAGHGAGQVPAAQARRRSRGAVALTLAVVAAVWLGTARVSLAAAEALQTRPVPWWVSPVWTLASVVLPALVLLACAFTVMALADG